MTILSISWVRNEADIIEAFVRHHAQFLDGMIVIDNGSTDDTLPILLDLQAEGLPLTVRRDATPIHRQGEALTELMHELHETMDPDWIFPLDADEFLRSDASDMRGVIATCMETPLAIPWRTYVPRESDPSESNPLKRITWRRSIEEPSYCKVAIPRAFQDERYRIPIGSHNVIGPGGDVPMMRSTILSLAHFPVRDAAQISRKVREGWARHLARTDRREGENFHWQRILETLPADALPAPEQVTRIALTYASNHPYTIESLVQDPLA